VGGHAGPCSWNSCHRGYKLECPGHFMEAVYIKAGGYRLAAGFFRPPVARWGDSGSQSPIFANESSSGWACGPSGRVALSMDQPGKVGSGILVHLRWRKRQARVGIPGPTMWDVISVVGKLPVCAPRIRGWVYFPSGIGLAGLVAVISLCPSAKTHYLGVP